MLELNLRGWPDVSTNHALPANLQDDHHNLAESTGSEVVIMEYEIVVLEPQTTTVVKGALPIAELPRFFQRAYGVLFHTLGRHGIEPLGEPIAFYPSEPSDIVEVEAGVVVGEEVEPEGEVRASTLPGGRVVTALHVGPYEALEQTDRAPLTEMQAAGLALRPVGMWEQYITDPSAEPDQSKWQTRIFVPIES